MRKKLLCALSPRQSFSFAMGTTLRDLPAGTDCIIGSIETRNDHRKTTYENNSVLARGPCSSPPPRFFYTAISPGRAATIAWTNTAGGNWNDATNWNPNQVPGAPITRS